MAAIHTTDRKDLKQLPPSGIMQLPGMKPGGLWWAIDDAWIQWAEAESYGIGPNTFRLTLDHSKLLVIGRDMSLDEFNDKFYFDATNGRLGRRFYSIDWRKVAESYAGIEIPVYSWKHRHEVLWYYGWDVASGCLWHPSALLGWEKVDRDSIRTKKTEEV